MNKISLFVSFVLVALGAVAAIYPFEPSIPRRSELVSVEGLLLSAEYRKRGSEIRIDHTDKSFFYMSYGRLCGNVHEKISSFVGKSIAIRYLPTADKNLFGNARPLFVYEIYSNNMQICSYEQVAEMIRNDFHGLRLLGCIALVGGFLVPLSVSFQRRSKQSKYSKSWNELRSDMEIEEGERIIGDQWRK